MEEGDKRKRPAHETFMTAYSCTVFECYVKNHKRHVLEINKRDMREYSDYKTLRAFYSLTRRKINIYIYKYRRTLRDVFYEISTNLTVSERNETQRYVRVQYR